MPVAKDGYLAVESLMSSIILMIRAFQRIVNDDYFLLPQHRGWNNHALDKNTIREVIESLFTIQLLLHIS